MSSEKDNVITFSTNVSSLKERIVDLFGNKPVTQIADEIDVSYNKLTNYLNGRSDIPTETLIKIANLKNCSINWLLTGEGPKHLPSGETPPTNGGEQVEDGEPERHAAAALARREYLEAKQRSIRAGADTFLPVLGYLNETGTVEWSGPIGRAIDRGDGIAWDDVIAGTSELQTLSSAWAGNQRFWLRALDDAPVRGIKSGALLLCEPASEPKTLPFRTCLWRVNNRTVLRDWRTDARGIYLVPVGDDGDSRPDRVLAWLVAIV